ncbi:ABC transporter permease [Streptomyces sp. NPDC056390]|uniref:ABC transporter permease n=1 Tax=Streptomyces sp. NPDC056390 TaxID=3345806 RepID=UPI0035DFD47F
MARLVLPRLAAMIPLLLIVSIIVFGLGQLIPGDPALTLAGENASPELIAHIRVELGLNHPPAIQYLDWVRHVTAGDLGNSLQTDEPVLGAVLSRLPVTLYLVCVSMVVAIVPGGALGIVAAVRTGGTADRLLSAAASVLVAVPSFVIGLFLVLLFAVHLGWADATGFLLPDAGLSASLRSSALPAIALGAGSAGEFALHVRSAVRASLEAEYTLALRSRGISTPRIVLKHALRNAAVPLTTVLALIFQHLLGASVVIEGLFAIPGMGTLGVDAVQHRDLPLLQGVVLVLAVTTLLANLLSDVLYGLLDPRTRR